MTDQDFQQAVLGSGKPALLEFTAEWSGASHINAPVLREMRDLYQDRMVFFRINVDAHHRTADAYRIHQIPTILLFRNGRPVDHMEGAVPRDVILGKVEALCHGLQIPGGKDSI